MKRCDLCDHAEVCGWRKDMKEQGCEHYCEHTISVPIGVTNGDVIKALFPQMNTKKLKAAAVMRIHNIFSASCDLEWWNAPYGTESEDKG